MKPAWKYLLYVGAVIGGATFLYILVETVRLRNTGFETKTLWDWMELLIIPLFLAGGAIYLERSERAVERRIAEDRTKEDRKLAEDRAKLEREIATDRQQEAALQAYLDRMADLLLKENLRTSENGEVRDVARIRTLSILRRLDARRKGLVTSFLYESGLLSVKKTIILLTDSDLSNAELRQNFLPSTNFLGTNLTGADLQRTYLKESMFMSANLQNANLKDAQLLQANLSYANLHNANLSDSKLMGADLTDADLSGANLSGANLTDAKVTIEQLATAKSLKGATMPDGTKQE